jgi:1-acyl-sn-glycerol-3-phosphate acyltransferase
MWRSYFFAFPFLVLYVTVGALVFVPLTWLTGDIRPIYWVARQGCRLGLWLSGVRMRVVNLEYAFQHPTSLFVANHVSNVEPAALFSVLPRIAVILKKELSKIPLLGYVMALGGFIYVDRKVRDSRKHAMQQGVKTLQSGVGLMVFPEGTRSPDKQLLPFRSGPFSMAMEAGIPIVPVTVHGTERLMPKGSSVVRPGRMALVFHAPIETKNLREQDRQELMVLVRATMEATLKGPSPLG